MSSKDTFHVLFCCESRKDADEFADLLRSSAPGLSVRARVITSMEELKDCLDDGSWELVLTTEGKDKLAAPLVIAAAR